MRTLVILGWLMVPVLAGAYHYGPGQEKLRLDDVAGLLREADRHAGAGEWPEAVADYDRALTRLPADRVGEARRIQLERAKARMLARQLPEASADLKGLVEELQRDQTADSALRTDADLALANAQYYMTWLMRLEGLGRDEWEPEIEASRQTYRLLAEQAERRGDGDAARARKEDLESAIRLARMDLSELQGLKLPGQCQGCKSGQCKGGGRKSGVSKGGAKKKDARSASSGPPPDNAGS